MASQTTSEFWDEVREAAQVSLNPSHWHTVIRPNRCPACKRKGSMTPKSNGMTCEACGFTKPFRR